MGAALYNIFIMPIELFIELVFSVMNTAFQNPGYAIIFVSIAVQLLCYPLYKRADAIQEQERQKQNEMKHWLEHIKNTFKGDERFMMQQTYYRLENYKPIYAIKSSFSLLLQIPFFIAAYKFLSNLNALNHASFLGIADLSQPDSLIQIGSLTLNLLPILMTLFNIISGIIYTKGFPVKDKIQTYGLAVIFLVLLYNSPSGLVFYWTLNNVFSLFKNIFLKKVKNTKKAITVTLFVIGIIACVYMLFFCKRSIKFKALIAAFSAVCFVPAVIAIIKKYFVKTDKADTERKIDTKPLNSVFYTAITAIFIILGIVIPVDVIKSSPVDFISIGYTPFGLVFKIACIFAGFLFVWLNIFYLFSTAKIKKVFASAAAVIAVVFPINFFFFGKDLGILSQYLVYWHYPKFSATQILVNILIAAVAAAAALIIFYKKTDILKRVYQIAIITFAVTAVVGLVSVEKTLAYEGHPEKNRAEETVEANNEPIMTLNKNGKNVIVFMLDRALSGYVPYMIEERPEIKEMFDGFTYYPNTLSFGGSTMLASSSLFGGYEYSPVEMNKRKDEALKDKHNEALTVLPKLFLDNDYDVTVLDPPHAEYKNISDLSIYDKYEEITARNIIGLYSKELKHQYSPLYEATQVRSFVFYSIMKSVPLALHNIIYEDGVYWSTGTFASMISSFLDPYISLDKLDELTEVSNDDGNSFVMMQNSTTHEPMLLDEENYTPSVDAKIPQNYIKTAADGSELDLSNENYMRQYHSNISSLLRIGEWLDYLRENGVYDNTRIIIVSDHGFDYGQFDNMKLSNGVNVEEINPLMMVKDFNSKGFSISDEFMMNADTPSLAVKDVIENPVNPFTGKKLDASEKASDAQIVTTSRNTDMNNAGNVFDTSDGQWWAVSDNIFDVKNWKKVEVN